jgi:predicted amidophosphoribosyltransferase
LRERGYNPVEQIARGWLEASSSRQRSYLGASQKGQAIGSSMILEHNWLRRSDRKSRQSALGAAARRRATRMEDDVSPEFESPPELEPASPLRSDAGFYLHDAGGGDASAPHRGLREALQGGTMHGRRHRTPETVVTLLDDVMTTGETLAAACRVLRRAGLSRIEVVTLMRRG